MGREDRRDVMHDALLEQTNSIAQAEKGEFFPRSLLEE